MKTKKIIFYIISIVGLIFLLSNNVFAVAESSNFAVKFFSGVTDSIYTGMLKFINLALSIIIGFMAGLLTFCALFLSYLLDMIFIKVPYIGDILGVKGDMVYVQNVQMITTLVLIFSVALWLILGGTSYIKSVFDQLTMGTQAGKKFNVFKDLLGKFVVVILIFSIPFSLPTIFKGINTLSGGLLRLEISGFSKEDQIIISSKPITSLVELGLSIPAVDGLSSDYKKNEGKEFTSIHNRKDNPYDNQDGIVNGNLQFNQVFESIIDKSLFQYGRFVSLATTISDKESISNIMDSSSESTAVNLEQQAIGHREGLVVFLFISVFYVVMLYTIFMKLFSLFMILVTRFVKILINSMFLTFHIAMLGSENTKKIGIRNLMSFAGDLLVTPLIAAFVGIAILVLGFFASVVGTGSDGVVYFATGDSVEGYEGVLFSGLLIMAILYGILSELTKQIEKIGANFENIFSENGGAGSQDSYSTPGEAMNSASKVWGLGKTVGTYLGVGKAGALAGGAILAKRQGDPVVNKLKEEATMEGAKVAHKDMLSEVKNEAIKKFSNKGNNTKIN